MNKLVIPSAFLIMFASIGAHASTVRADLLGNMVPAEQASRTVQIEPATRSVDVMHGEVVRFVVDGKAFAFDFDGAQAIASFDLREVTPPGLLDHAVMAHVRPNPEDGGRGGRGR